MSASQQCRDEGLSGLKELSEAIHVSRQTLQNWYINRPEAFKALILGTIEMKKRKEQ